jgi:hypothetical protein
MKKTSSEIFPGHGTKGCVKGGALPPYPGMQAMGQGLYTGDQNLNADETTSLISSVGSSRYDQIGHFNNNQQHTGVSSSSQSGLNVVTDDFEEDDRIEPYRLHKYSMAMKFSSWHNFDPDVEREGESFNMGGFEKYVPGGLDDGDTTGSMGGEPSYSLYGPTSSSLRPERLSTPQPPYSIYGSTLEYKRVNSTDTTRHAHSSSRESDVKIGPAEGAFSFF